MCPSINAQSCIILISLLFSLFIESSACAQVKSPSTDTSLINQLNAESLNLIKKDTIRARELSNEAIIKSERIKYLKGLGDGYTRLGILEKDRSNYLKALAWHQYALKYRTEDKDTISIGKSLNNIGNIFQKIDDYDSAVIYHLRAVKIAELKNDKSNLIDYLLNLGIDFKKNEDYTKALDYINQSLKLAEELQETIKIYKAYSNLASTYIADSLYTKGLFYTLKIIRNRNILPDDLVADAYNNSGIAYQDMENGNLDSAIYYFTKAINIFKESHSGDWQIALRNMGLIFDRQENYSKAIEYLNKSNQLALESSQKQLLADNYESLSDIYIKLNQYEPALKNLNLSVIYRDSVFNEEKAAKIEELNTEYQTEKKNKEIAQNEIVNARQSEKIKQQQIVIGGVISGLIIISLVFTRRQLRKKLEYEKKLTHERTRISSDLHDEIGSTLSSIGMYSDFAKQQVENNKQAEAIDLLTDISNNSREMMDDMSDIIWMINPRNDSFENVISRIENYAHKICEAKNIYLHLNIENNFDGLRMQMEQRKNSYLILKESINNAIKYAACKNLFLAIRKEDNIIYCEVRDDGKGFNTDLETEGNGLKNIRMRSEEIGANIQINSVLDEGTTVQLKMKFT